MKRNPSDPWEALCAKVGWNLLVMGFVMIAVAHVPTPALPLAKWTAAVFFTLGLFAAAFLVYRRVWPSGWILALGCLAGAYWALVLKSG